MNETAADPNDAAFGDIAPPGDDFPFVLLPPFKEEEILSVERQVILHARQVKPTNRIMRNRLDLATFYH